MKRCPECRRDYYDDSLLYCLDDGSALLEGPASGDEPATAILDVRGVVGSSTPNKARNLVLAGTVLTVLITGVGGYFYLNRASGTTGPFLSKNDGYLRAKLLIGNENREDIDSAIALLEQAVKNDLHFAAGWAQLARAYNQKAFYFASSVERRKLNEDAEVAVERSLEIDPNLADGHFARGLILWTHAKRFPHELAIRSYKRAIALDPTLDEAHHQLALVYIHLGLFEEARAEVGRTLEINPGNTLARLRYGVVDLYEKKYDDAYKFFKSTPTEQTPALQTFQVAMVLYKLGRLDEASETIDKYLLDNPQDQGGVATSVRAVIQASEGKFDEAEASIKRAEAMGRDFGHFHHTAFNIASAYALMNKPDEAVNYLQLADDDGFPCYPLFAFDESLASISHNERYLALLTKLKQQWETYKAEL